MAAKYLDQIFLLSYACRQIFCSALILDEEVLYSFIVDECKQIIILKQPNLQIKNCNPSI